MSEVWAKGGEGGTALAEEVVRLCENNEKCEMTFAYELCETIEEKIRNIARRIYRAENVEFTPEAAEKMQKLQELGFGELPVCIAKTQYSFSDNEKLLGAPEGFTLTVRDMKVSAGAGFVVALTGKIMTMPGLPKVPAAEKIDVDENGRITGLF